MPRIRVDASIVVNTGDVPRNEIMDATAKYFEDKGFGAVVSINGDDITIEVLEELKREIE